MGILYVALIFGLVVLVLLLNGMKKVKFQAKGKTSEKLRAILKILLLILVICYVLVFAAVIIKTMII